MILFIMERARCVIIRRLFILIAILTRVPTQRILFHLGNDGSEIDMEEVDMDTLAGPSTLGTGGGTDHDDGSIRARPAYRYASIFVLSVSVSVS